MKRRKKSAARELEEELGFVAARLEKLSGVLCLAGLLRREDVEFIWPPELSKPGSSLGGDGDSRGCATSFSQALSMITTGEIDDAKTTNWHHAGRAARRPGNAGSRLPRGLKNGDRYQRGKGNRVTGETDIAFIVLTFPPFPLAPFPTCSCLTRSNNFIHSLLRDCPSTNQPRQTTR